MSQALYRKWRPHRWEDVVGQEHIIQTLRNAVAGGRLAHAYLFSGPRGTGKTTTARLLAKAVNCLDETLANRPCDRCAYCQAVNEGRFLDLIEIDAASNTSVEDVRDLRDKINFSPNQGRYKVYIIDEVHMLSTAAFNALLKTLEEPPAHAIFILATTEAHKIPTTVLSRCQGHEFRRIPVADIVSYLGRIVEGEHFQVEPAALNLVAHQASGGMRDAISLLDQLTSTGQEVTLEMAHKVLGTATNESVLSLMDALVKEDSSAGLNVIHTLSNGGIDPRQMARQVVEYLRGLLLMRTSNGGDLDITPEVKARMSAHAQTLSIAEMLRLVKIFSAAASESRGVWIPALPLEMAFLEALQTPAAAPAAPMPSGGRQVARPAPAGQAAAIHSLAPAVEIAASPAAESTQPAEEPPPSPAIEQNWGRILEAAREQNGSVYGLLNTCKTRQLKDNLLTLGIATDVLKAKLEDPAAQKVIKAALKKVLGRDLEVRVVTLSGKRNTPPPGVDSDGMVASALSDLGGEIVDIH